MTLRLIFATAALLTATLTHAQANVIPPHATIYSADGTKIGRIDQIVSADGAPRAVKVIYRGKFVTIPADTLSPASKGLKTSLTNEALRNM